ncbi:MAG: glycosyltransferase [Synechocystis sp.]|nr:glycosyltransferase [Synechocystis sp.]
MAQNWNQAIALATGKYVMVLHDDDFFVAGGLDRLVAQLRGLADQYPVCLFGVQVVDDRERVMGSVIYVVKVKNGWQPGSRKFT